MRIGVSPEFGYWFFADRARDAGQVMVDRTVWQIRSGNGWWCVFGKNMVPQREGAWPCGS